MLEGVVFVELSVRSVWFVASLRQGHVIMVLCMKIGGKDEDQRWLLKLPSCAEI
jgi:hypothetical protein